MEPIDYVVLEWPGKQPDGAAAPLIIELVDRGIIRILDVAFMAKDENGVAFELDLGSLEAYGAFAGASSGLLNPRISRRPRPPSNPGRPPPCSCGRTAGPRPSPSPCAAPAASSSRAAASPSRP